MRRGSEARLLVPSLVVACALFHCAGAFGQAEMVVQVTALEPTGVAVEGIRFVYQGVETEATTDSGMTEVRARPGGGRTIAAGTAIELSLPRSVGATWFLIDDTVHVPGPGESPAEVVVMRRADMVRLAGNTSEALAARLSEDLSPEERRRVLVEEAGRYGLSERTLDLALRAFGKSAEGMLEAGIAQYLAHEYEAAERNLRAALEDAEERKEAGEGVVAQAKEDIVESARYLGQALYEQGSYEEAAGVFRKAVTVVPDDTGLLSWYASALYESAKWAQAEPVLRRALAIAEASNGPDHPAVATALNNLAQLLQATNRLGEAEPLLRRALAIDEASYGAEHPKVATALNNLALLLQDTNRLGEAEALMRRALAIDEASYGAEHPKVARDLNNLAQLLQDTNRLGEAEPLLRRALAILEESLGSDHPSTATVRENLRGLVEELEAEED